MIAQFSLRLLLHLITIGKCPILRIHLVDIMEALKPLQNITRLSNCVIRILGQNPGKFTLQGTNTYVIGRKPPFILVDTGEGREEYVPLLENVLRSSREQGHEGQNGTLISDIVVTHRHRDHYGGLAGVVKLLRRLNEEGRYSGSNYSPPRIHKFPSSTDSEGPPQENDLWSVLSSLPIQSYCLAPSGAILHDLKSFQIIETIDASVSLQVFHTPGHTPDSICLLLRDSNADSLDILLTADSVLGQGTAVFEDLHAYLQSLQMLLSLHNDPSVKANFKVIYPGHGPVVDDGPELISNYIKHRLEREAQIVDVLSRASPLESEEGDGSGQAWTIWNIVREIYKDYPENLWLPAAHGVRLHLNKLEKDSRVRCIDGEGTEQRWILSWKLRL